MTYGEAVMAQKETMRMIKGSWEADELPKHTRLAATRLYATTPTS